MRQQRTGLLVIAMMFMMVLARVFSGGQAQADDPDFTHVTDILDGWRQLLRTDDLFLMQDDVIYPPGVGGARLHEQFAHHVHHENVTQPWRQRCSDRHQSANVRFTHRRGGQCAG